MNASANQTILSSLPSCTSNARDFNEGRRTLEIRPAGLVENFKPPSGQHWNSKRGIVNININISMRDRSKNRKPLQKGRNLSIEAIQTVQALKRGAKKDHRSLQRLFDSKVSRLLKIDMIAVLRELLRQNECLLALKVFEDVRKEYWYKPQVSLYADVISALASNGLFDKVELIYAYLKTECNVEPDIEGFNALLTTLMTSNVTGLAMECFYLMKELGCEPDRSSFRILINGLESKGESGLSAVVRQEAQKYFGQSLEFLEEKEGSDDGEL